MAPEPRWLLSNLSTHPARTRGSNVTAEEAAAEGQLGLVAVGSGSYCPTLAPLLAADLITRYTRPRDSEPEILDNLRGAFRRTAEAVCRAGALDGAGHGYYAGLSGWAVAVHIGPEDLFIAHLGDARAYRIEDGQVEPLTEDQVMAKHPHIVVSYFGGSGTGDPVLQRRAHRGAGVVLLCSRRSAEALGPALEELRGDSVFTQDRVDTLGARAGGAVALGRIDRRPNTLPLMM